MAAEIRKSIKLLFLCAKDLDQDKVEAAIKKLDPTIEITLMTERYYKVPKDTVGDMISPRMDSWSKNRRTLSRNTQG